MGCREAKEDGARVVVGHYSLLYVYNCPICGQEVRVRRYDRALKKRCACCRELIKKAGFDPFDVEVAATV